MFEQAAEFDIKVCAGFNANNLTTLHNKTSGCVYIAYFCKDVIQIVSFSEETYEQKMNEAITFHEILNKAAAKSAATSTLMQVHLCLPSSRSSGVPVLVVLSTGNISVIDVKTRKILFFMMLFEPSSDVKPCTFARGITSIENNIFGGTSAGEIVCLACTGEKSFQQSRKNLKEHNTSPIVDMATCAFDHLSVSGDVDGLVVIWAKNLKSVISKISTGQEISVLNILRKQVFCGNLLGQIFAYSINTGILLAEMNAHCRQITAIAVAPESAYILTASEDSYIRVWKLHSRDPDAYKIEFRYCLLLKNVSIMGAAFNNLRGSGFSISSYENPKLLSYRISLRKPTTAQDQQQQK